LACSCVLLEPFGSCFVFLFYVLSTLFIPPYVSWGSALYLYNFVCCIRYCFFYSFPFFIGIKCYCPNKLRCCSIPLLLHSGCPKPVQISSFGRGTRLSYTQTSQTANSETNIQYEVGTSGNSLKCHIISAGL